MIANIVLDDGLILPHSANPTGSNFRERHVSAIGRPRMLSVARLAPAQATDSRYSLWSHRHNTWMDRRHLGPWAYATGPANLGWPETCGQRRSNPPCLARAMLPRCLDQSRRLRSTFRDIFAE